MKGMQGGTKNATAAPDMPKRSEPVAPFKARAHGVCAMGTVSEVRRHPEGGKNVRLTIRHGEPKKSGEFDPYDSGSETGVTIPAHLAKRFPFGKKVSVHVMPQQRGGARGGGGEADGEAGAVDDGDDSGEDAGEKSGSVIGKAFQKVTKKK